jgi:hypothetical protein
VCVSGRSGAREDAPLGGYKVVQGKMHPLVAIYSRGGGEGLPGARSMHACPLACGRLTVKRVLSYGGTWISSY